MEYPLVEELWLLCLKAKCDHVNDKGLLILQESFRNFCENILSISTTLAQHNCRTIILTQDIMQAQQVLFRQRENCTISTSGYLLSTALAAAESNEDMEVDEDYEERSSTLTNSDSEDDEHEEEDNLETLEEEATIDNEKEFLTILEIESQTDIDLIENNFALQKMMVPRLISSKSYLQLFKNNCQIKSLSIEAFNSLTGICEYQIHLNLEGEHSLIQVIYENMVVPIRIVMKLTNKENELDALALKNKYMQIESGCISSLTNARKSQTNLLYTLQKMLISIPSNVSVVGSSHDTAQMPSLLQSDDAFTRSLLNQLAEEEAQTSLLKEQLQDTRKKLHTLQETLSKVNELSFSLRNLTAPPRKRLNSDSQQCMDKSLSTTIAMENLNQK